MRYKHDVCISFRGEEIRRTFLSHLIHSLDRKGIRSVTSAGNNSSQNQAVWESEVAIYVISKSYISLDLWVEELDEIIAYKKKAVPVFIRVDPLDVLRDLNLALVGTDQALERVKNWLDGHVVNKSGFISNDWEDDSQLVDQITCFVSDNLTQDSRRWFPILHWLKSRLLEYGGSGDAHRYEDEIELPLLLSSSLYKSSDMNPISHHNKPSKPVNESSSSKPSETSIELPSSSEQFTTKMNPFAEHIGCDLVGLKHQMKEVLSMLQKEDSTEEVRTIGIYGIEGIGKTTLGKHVYKEISPQFQHHFYITKQGRSLQEILVDDETLSFSEMVGRKILLVADSVDDIKQLKDFADHVSVFGPGSRVIVITQDMSLLSQYGVKHIFKVTCPVYEESIQIFSQFAFKQINPVSSFERFSCRAVEVAGHIPLALKMLGCYLYGKEEDEWESTLCRLEESDNNYIKVEVLQYNIEDRFASRSLTILEHEENEVNRFPLYSFTL